MDIRDGAASKARAIADAIEIELSLRVASGAFSMNIPLGPSFETIAANLLAPKQLLRPPPEDSGPYEPGERESPIEQQNTRNVFERACIAGAIVLVLATLVLML